MSRSAPRAAATAPTRPRAVSERADGDVAFAQAHSGRPVVLGVYLTPTHNGSQASLTTKAGFSFVGDPPTSLVTALQRRAGADPRARRRRGGLGFLNWLPDNDRVVRRVPLLLDSQWPDPAEPRDRDAAGRPGRVGLYREVDDRLRQHCRQERRDRLDQGRRRGRAGAGGRPIARLVRQSDPRRSIPAWKVLQPDADLSDLAGKLVFIGASASCSPTSWRRRSIRRRPGSRRMRN